MSAQMTKTVAFLGANTGVGLSALKHTLAAGHLCIALCRTPSKLTTIFSPETTPNLKIIQGNAKDVSAVSQCLQGSNGNLVDEIVSTIGAVGGSSSKLAVEDNQVCSLAIAALLSAISQLRQKGVAGRPLIIVCSTTGISSFGRDVPVALLPLYRVVIKVPLKDKKAMENTLIASDEDFTIVRPSLLMNGETEKEVRVGIEDSRKGVESKVVGYTITREDSGRWIAENLVLRRDVRFLKKAVTITY